MCKRGKEKERDIEGAREVEGGEKEEKRIRTDIVAGIATTRNENQKVLKRKRESHKGEEGKEVGSRQRLWSWRRRWRFLAEIQGTKRQNENKKY